MTMEDMRIVIGLMDRLYTDLYNSYKEFKEANSMLQEMILTREEEAGIRKAKEIALNLIKRGLDEEEIAEITKLDIETVQSLYSEK
jgi:predicted transposase YdaD